MKKTALFTIFSSAIFSVPIIAFGQNFSYVNNWLKAGLDLLNLSIIVITVLMTLYFLVQVFNLIRAKDSEGQKKARLAVFNAMLGLFLAVAVWGIIRIAGNIVGVDTTGRGSNNTPPVTCPPGTIYRADTDSCRANVWNY